MSGDAARNTALLEVTDLAKYFPLKKGLGRREVGMVKAVDGISFEVKHGEILGIVGESGSGKTTAARCILRAIEPTRGRILYHDDSGTVDVGALGRRELRRFRRNMQMIFQDPYASLNPRMMVREIIGEPLIVYGVAKGRVLESRVRELMQQVGLDDRYLNRYPHAFSGGQRQRIGIARALALKPSLVVCDEAVSALDMSMQAQVLNLLEQLQQQLKLTYVFIAHDLSVVRHFCHRIAVMYAGRIVENGATEDVFSNPLHPYTEALLSAAPNTEMGTRSKRIALSGEIPDPLDMPHGCAFHPRCQHAREACSASEPPLNEVRPGRRASCHFVDELSLQGI
jgi:peptide/nickel transport system ATP-binding protein